MTGHVHLDDKSKLAIAMEMKDSADLYQRDVDPTRFFTIVLPCFIEILGNGKPTLASGTTENVRVIHQDQ